MSGSWKNKASEARRHPEDWLSASRTNLYSLQNPSFL